VGVVTGASRGIIGYTCLKELCSRMSAGKIYGTTRGNPEQLNDLVRQEVSDLKQDMVEFKVMETKDIVSIVELRNYIQEKHGQVDILINNAGHYFYPSQDRTEHFCQVQKTLEINYWGLKNVCNAFLPMFSPAARIVNMSSNLGHLSTIPGMDIKKRFSAPDLNEQELDGLVLEFQHRCTEYNDDWAGAGWPRCAYTVSKVAVNAYTRILQRRLESRGQEDVVINAIHPGSAHSKIAEDSPLSATEAAQAVVSCAVLPHPCTQPRGKFIWHDLQIVDWDQDSLQQAVTAKV